MADDKIQKIIDLIQKSDLDATIKGILIRDLQSEGLTDFLREQIKAYCLEALMDLDEDYNKAVEMLKSQSKQDPAP